MPQRQQKLLDKYLHYLNSTKESVEANFRVIEKMLSNVDTLFINSKSTIEPQDISSLIQDPDSDKVHITLKQIVRDWTDLGSTERDQCYKPILDEIMEHFGAEGQKNNFKVVSLAYKPQSHATIFFILACSRRWPRSTCLRNRKARIFLRRQRVLLVHAYRLQLCSQSLLA